MPKRYVVGLVKVVSLYVDCPSCGEGFQGTSDGSMQVTQAELAALPPDYVCLGCGDIVGIPRAKLNRLFR
jgi:hypothetical protein